MENVGVWCLLGWCIIGVQSSLVGGNTGEGGGV